MGSWMNPAALGTLPTLPTFPGMPGTGYPVMMPMPR